MKIKPELFLYPPTKYRLHPMNHVWPAENRSAYVRMLKEYGYGGMVTNVNQSNGFTTNPENIEDFREILQILKEQEFDFWLYDESGYPSGYGDGQVLAGHPELEAKGLYMRRQVTYEPRHMSFRLDQESDKIVWAAKYSLDTTAPHESILLIDSMEPVAFTRDTVECDMNAREVLFVFCVKAAYEGSHCTHNICSYSRYINVLNPAGVRRFLELCYEPIAKAIPDAYSQATAVFTDEPSLQTPYAREYEVWPYALLPWDDSLPSHFENTYGFSMMKYLPYLFEGTADAYPIRIKFYNLIGKLIAASYTGQIRKWCEEHGGRFSGHYLGEEMIADHVRDYGSLLEVQKASSYPGIDVLACYPEGYYYNTAKYVQMAVRKKGTNGMMAEVCPFDNVEIFERDPIENFTAVMNLNYLAGVRVTHSYFETDYSEFENGMFANFKPRDEEKFGKCKGYMNRAQAQQLNAYVGRLGYMLDGLRNNCNTFLYYGIEDTQAKTQPGYTAAVGRAIEADGHTIPVMKAVYEAGHDFYYIDKEDLVNAADSLKAGAPKISGCEVKTVIIPGLDVMHEESISALMQLQEAGVSVFFLDKIPTYGGEINGDISEWRKCFNSCALSDVLEHLNTREEDFVAEADADIMLLKARYTTENGDLYFVVNNSRKHADVLLKHSWNKTAVLFNPENGEITTVKMGEKLHIPSLRGMFLKFED